MQLKLAYHAQKNDRYGTKSLNMVEKMKLEALFYAKIIIGTFRKKYVGTFQNSTKICRNFRNFPKIVRRNIWKYVGTFRLRKDLKTKQRTMFTVANIDQDHRKNTTVITEVFQDILKS